MSEECESKTLVIQDVFFWLTQQDELRLLELIQHPPCTSEDNASTVPHSVLI